MPITGNIEPVSLLLAVVGFLIVYTLNGIKTEIRDTKDAVVALRDSLANLDKRVTVIESRCHAHHGD